MAEKLSIQIALEGGDQIAKQLADIGEAGQKAFADIAKSAEQAGGFKELKPEEVTAKLQEMGVTGVDAIKKIQNAVQSAGRLETLVQGITSVENGFAALAKAAPVIGTAIVAGLTAATKATIAFADSVNKVNEQAIKLGAGVEQLDRFRAGLEQAGVSAKSIGEILQSKLASEQGVAGLEAFIRELERMPDSLARSKAATEQFGAAGAELIRILQAGGRLTGFATGKLINAEDAKKATELGQALNRLESTINRLGTVQIAPQLTTGLNVVTQTVKQLGAQLEAAPWSTFVAGAQAMSSPVAAVFTAIIGRITAVGPAIQQATQQGATAFTTFGTVTQQSAQQATTAFTTFGTTVQQSGQQATGMFTQWGASADAATAKTQTFSASLASIAWGNISSTGVAAWNAIVTAAQGAGTAITTFVSNLGTITWDIISGLGVAAWNAIVTAVQGAGTAITEFVSNLGTITWDIISGLGVAAWNALTGAIQGAIDKLLVFIGLKPSAPATGGGAPGKASGGLLGGRGSGTSDSNLAWLSRGEYITPAHVVRQPGVLSLLEVLRRSGNIPAFQDGGMLTSLVEGSGFDPQEFIRELKNSLEGVIARIAAALMVVTSEIDSISLARGGLLGGRGSGTSDSNLAWVSRGEHIMPARAVAQPGVLAFLEALRRSGGNLRGVLDGMGRFALGGMMRGPMPAFAGGGLAGGMSNVTIQFPGLPAIGGLRASADVVDQLHRAAALAQVRSGGRKPSRYS